MLRSERLDGEPVDAVHADLTARRGGAGVDLTQAQRLYRERVAIAFMGDTKGGPFDVPGTRARESGCDATRESERPAELRTSSTPWRNGMDVTRRPSGQVDRRLRLRTWRARRPRSTRRRSRHIAREHGSTRCGRRNRRRETDRDYWWRHERPRPEMWRALEGLSRYIATPTVAKHRLFVWLDARVCPDHQLIVIARDDDAMFGILHSRFHEAWSLRLGTWLGKGNDPRYTPTTTFETFTFPEGLSPDLPAAAYATDPRATAIADAARRLVELRERWLHPPEWVDWVEEPVPGYPKRPVARDDTAAKELKRRTLTLLYNNRPQWLDDAHAALDAAVAAAYGWPADVSDDEVLDALLELNLRVL